MKKVEESNISSFPRFARRVPGDSQVYPNATGDVATERRDYRKWRTDEVLTLNPTDDFGPQLKIVFGELLRPLVVKKVLVAKKNRDQIRGVLLTFCPIEMEEAARDFEVAVEGCNPIIVGRIVVGGKRILRVQQEIKPKPKDHINGSFSVL
jgi:hypothetical protein